MPSPFAQGGRCRLTAPVHRSPSCSLAPPPRNISYCILCNHCFLLGIFHTAYFATTASYLEYSKLHTLELQLLTRLPPELIGYCILLTAQIMPTFLLTILCARWVCAGCMQYGLKWSSSNFLLSWHQSIAYTACYILFISRLTFFCACLCAASAT